MILSAKERKALNAVIAELQTIAASCGQNSSIGTAIYRNAAALKTITSTAPVTKDGRADGHKC